MQKLLPFLLPLFMLASCTSTGIHQLTEEQPMRISYITARGKFELANPAHTDPVKLYSTTRSMASPMKVTKDAIMIDIIEFLGSNGYSEHETTGAVLDSGLVGYSVVFEVESQTGVSHWGITRVSTANEISQMSECRDYFFNIWNNVEAFQTVDNQKGDFSFKSN
ncbi:MAG: hypothetical protein ACI8TQ_002144 [Planctomycetota bacterium]|jgi:hypothetical protein